MERLQKTRIHLVYMILLVSAICCFSGCNTNAPSIGQVENLFSKYESDFRTVSDYLTGFSAEKASIRINAEEIYADFKDQAIEDPLVLNCLQHLRNAGCSSIYMDRTKNSISFTMWKTDLIGDAESGVLYAIDAGESTPPTAQFLTKLLPLQGKDWYYYVADYEEWRNYRQR